MRYKETQIKEYRDYYYIQVERLCDANIEQHIESWKDEFEKDEIIPFE